MPQIVKRLPQKCLIIIVVIVFCHSEQCENITSLSFSYSPNSCAFNYQFFNSDCSQFSFRDCVYRKCTQHDNNGCIQHEPMTSNLWRVCTRQCCNADREYPQIFNSLGHCQDYLNNMHTIDTAKSMPTSSADSAFSGTEAASLATILVFCTVILTLAICCCKRHYPQLKAYIKSSRCFYSEVQINNDKIQNPKYIEPSAHKWISDRYNQSYQDACSVCLDVGPTLQLQCRHTFHKNCIITCLSMKEECILCRSKQINLIRVYCEFCYKSYFQTTLTQSKSRLMKSTEQCSECEKKIEYAYSREKMYVQ